MKVLGISAFGRNPAAALIVDGALIAFAEEERFVRIKSADGRFPARAARYCLKQGQYALADIDEVAVGWDHARYRFQIPLFAAGLVLSGSVRGGKTNDGLIELLSRLPGHTLARIKLELRAIEQLSVFPRIRFYNHHLAHAASTFYCAGMPEALVLIMDGSGENRATSIFLGKDTTLREIAHFTIPASLGWFYAAFSSFLGFKAYEEDGFLMGLAAYGRPDGSLQRQVDSLLMFDRGRYSVDRFLSFFGRHTHHPVFGDKMIKLFGPPRHPSQPISQFHKDLAFAVQKRLEETICHLASYYAKSHRQQTLCLAGGVALNVKAVGALAASGLFRRIFVQPAGHDAGVALGAAQLASLENGLDPRFQMNHAYWGPEFSDRQIRDMLELSGVSFCKPDCVAERTAGLIAENKLVGWFRGRMEVGPRALGHRSILANPAGLEIKDDINRRVKFRETWRPFCPSVTVRAAKKLFPAAGETLDATRFMGVAYDIEPNRAQEIPAVVHVDHTTRPQWVDPAADDQFSRLIQFLGQTTGNEVVLNTSLNIKGEPLACTPQDALRVFFSTGLDYLIIGDYLLSKNHR